jgi:hypothetical protein
MQKEITQKVAAKPKAKPAKKENPADDEIVGIWKYKKGTPLEIAKQLRNGQWR